jgi:iron complex outermembrane receptor protein
MTICLGASTDSAQAEGMADADGSGDSLAEVTVTAQRRSENQQKVPVAVTVISADQIANQGVFDPLGLSALAPGLNAEAFNGDKTAIYLSIRGQSFTTGTIYSSVIPYFSEVPLVKLTEADFFDLQNVEVLRGPQGTLFGRVTNGGAVLLEPTRPGNEFGGYVTQKYGDYNLHTTSGAVDLPIISDRLSVRLAGELGRQDGYVRNVYNGLDLNDVNYNSGRISILATPWSGVENLTIVEYERTHEHGADSRLYFVNSPAVIAGLTPVLGAAGATSFAAALQQASAQQLARGPTETSLDSPTSHRSTALYIVNKTNVNLTDSIVLRNIYGYMHYKQFQGADYEGSDLPFVAIVSSTYPANLDDRVQFSDEIQLQGKSFDSRLEWTAGLYADKNRNGGPTNAVADLYGIFQSVSVADETAESKAVYAQTSYDLSSVVDGLSVRGGIRYTRDEESGSSGSYLALLSAVNANPSIMPYGQCLSNVSGLTGLLSASPCLSASSSVGTFTYTYGVDYQIAPRAMVYAKMSRGYRPGGFNPVPEGIDPSYLPEFDLSREIGLKADFNLASVKIRTNLAAFYDTYSDIQRRISVFVDGSSYSAVLNTAESTIKGVELETTIQPIDLLQFVVRYSHAVSSNDLSRYTQAYLEAACPANPYLTAPDSTKACPLNLIARLPRNTVDVDGQVTLPVPDDLGRMVVGAAFHYQASEWANDTNYINPDTFQKGYSLFNLNASWSNILSHPIDLKLFATNVANRTYIASIGSVSNMGNLGIAQATFGPPRMYGGSITYRFGHSAGR